MALMRLRRIKKRSALGALRFALNRAPNHIPQRATPGKIIHHYIYNPSAAVPAGCTFLLSLELSSALIDHINLDIGAAALGPDTELSC